MMIVRLVVQIPPPNVHMCEVSLGKALDPQWVQTAPCVAAATCWCIGVFVPCVDWREGAGPFTTCMTAPPLTLN